MRFFGHGNGQDGTRVVSSTATETITRETLAANASSAQKTINLTGSYANGDVVFIHQTRHATGHGRFELNRITNYSAGNTTLEYNLEQDYYTGAQVIKVPQYRGFTINSGVTLSVPAWNDTNGGIQVIMSQSIVKIAGTWNARAKGFTAPGTESAGTAGVCLQGKSHVDNSQDYATSANDSGGGGGQRSPAKGSGGGGGGHNGPGENGEAAGLTAGTGGATVGNDNFTLIYLGSGGGQGAGDQDGPPIFTGGFGGYGGGIIIVIAPYIWVPTGGLIDMRGQDAGNGSGNSSNGGGGGGGGAGGSFWGYGLSDCDISGAINFSGGIGGLSPHGDGGDGGDGAPGRGRLDTCQKTGNTTPSATLGTGVWCGDAGVLTNIGA